MDISVEDETVRKSLIDKEITHRHSINRSYRKSKLRGSHRNRDLPRAAHTRSHSRIELFDQIPVKVK